MARIRTIKPEFPQSETVGALSRDARLLFVQLWTLADDAGRLRGASRMLASLLYPYDDDAPGLMPAWLEELEDKRCIRRYEIEGSQYIEIINWLKHQKIDRPSESRLPEFREEAAITREHSRASDADLGPRTSTKDPSSPVAKATRPNEKFEEFWKEYPRRKGDNPKAPARKQFELAVKQGADPDAIIAGVKAACAKNRDKIGTEFIPQAVKWLRDRRWEDYQPEASHPPQEPKPIDWDQHIQFFKSSGRWPRELGGEPGMLTCRVPKEILDRHGFAVAHETEAA